MSGLSWFGVLEIVRPLPSRTRHAHPDPNRLVAAALNCSSSLANPPHPPSTAAARAPDGSPPALGAMIVQKNEWFQWPPPLFRTAVRTASGTAFRFETRSSTLRSASSGAFSIAAFRLLTYA